MVLGFLLVIGGAICLNFIRADKYRSQQEVYMAEVVADLSTYYEDYDKEVPKIEFEVGDLEGVKIKNDQIRSKKYDGRKTGTVCGDTGTDRRSFSGWDFKVRCR